MPAPPAAVLAALRAGNAITHWFFELDHSQGVVRAWDGIGDFVFNGSTFKGVGGLASLQGVGSSTELQNHEVLVTINAVPFTALTDVDTSIRDRAATLWKVAIDETGAVIGSRVMFKGLGDNMRVKPGVDTLALVVKLRAPLADWSTAPAQFYTFRDQQRLFPGDSGMSEVAGLENASVTGWSKNVETTGGVPILLTSGAGFNGSFQLKSNITGVPVGSGSLGLMFDSTGAGYPFTLVTISQAIYKENGTGANAQAAAGNRIQVGGVDCYIDIAGDVRSPGGQLLYPPGVSAAKMRIQTAISANGSAGATSAALFSAQNNVIAKAGSGYTLSTNDQTPLVYENSTGTVAKWSSGLKLGATACVEETSGTAVTLSGGTSGNLQVGGVDCKISANGVLLSSTGKRIIRSGGSAATDFLRVWT